MRIKCYLTSTWDIFKGISVCVCVYVMVVRRKAEKVG